MVGLRDAEPRVTRVDFVKRYTLACMMKRAEEKGREGQGGGGVTCGCGERVRGSTHRP